MMTLYNSVPALHALVLPTSCLPPSSSPDFYSPPLLYSSALGI